MNFDVYIYPLYLSLIIFATIYAIYKFTLLPIIRIPKDIDFRKALDIIQSIISIELELYENDIFNQQETLTNSQYENYLRDVVGHIENALTPEIIRAISVYMTEDEIYTWIVRLVRRYFDEKAVVPLYDDEKDEDEI